MSVTEHRGGPCLLLTLLMAGVSLAGSRQGGSFTLECESINGGGTVTAASAGTRLGGSLGQGGGVLEVRAVTPSTLRAWGGFWGHDDVVRRCGTFVLIR